jgi:quercetin dioxygenase-like cupin family protein
MKLAFYAVLLTSIAVAAQNAPSDNSQQGRFRKQVLQNDRLTAYSVEIPPGESSVMHRHDRDTLVVAVSGGTTESDSGSGSPVRTKFEPGDVRFRPAPYSHSVKNIGKEPFRVLDIEFADKQGAQEKAPHKKSHYCNPGSKEACVTEEYLFCTERFCVEDVTMGPGAKSSKHTHDTEHMLIAITDYNLDDDTTGKGITHRAVKSGGVEFLPAGITHVLTNTSNETVRLVAIIFK